MDPRRELLPQELPTFERDLEMARLRVVEGLTLAEIGARSGVGRERVRQILRARFSISGVLRAIREDLGLKSAGLLPGDLIRLYVREEDTDEDRELWKQLLSGS